MTVKILRGHAGSAGSFSEYNVPYSVDGRNTVMDVLNYIFENLDSTLSFYSHSVCDHGICGRCGVRVNGKVKLACTALADTEEIILEPKNNNVVIDLITK